MMIEAYSLNTTINAGAPVVWDNVNIEKGCTAVLSAPATINLNKCGVYAVTCNATSTASVSLQLYKNGVAIPQTATTGTTPSITTLVQVSENNTCKCCSAPTTLQLRNVGTAEATLSAVNIVVTKVC